MQQTVVPGVAMWSAWQPDRNLYFNSFFIRTPHGNLVVDPLPLGDADAAEIEASGGVAWIAITNRDHERGARACAERFGAKIAASEAEESLLSGAVDRRLRDGDEVAGGRVIALDGCKTPGEFALWFADSRALVVGDVLWGRPAGAVTLMPDEKLADPARAVAGVRTLAACRPEHLLLGDGACVFGDARRVLWAALEERGELYVNRINLDELVATPISEPAAFACFSADIDGMIGGEKLGYRLAIVPSGKAWAPEHWHGAEEELFVVLEGSPTLLGPRGTWELRAGDVIAFPTRPSASHRIENRSAGTARILMIANTDPRDVCYYPHSRKVLVEATDLMVRDRPQLAYWDGE